MYSNYSFLEKLKSKRIISIWDASTLALLENGVTPHLAVFDFKIKRKKITAVQKKKLLSSFNKIRKYKNPKGTISNYILKNAKKLITNDGAVLIDGEEDLLTLAFILASGKNDVILYGQPNKGIVLVIPDKKLKNKIRRLLASAAT